MATYLMRNDEQVCQVISSADSTEADELGWQQCTLLTTSRVQARPADLFTVVVGSREAMPFLFGRCRIAAEGWEVEGRISTKTVG